MTVETHTQVGTGKRLVHEDVGGTGRAFGWIQVTSPTPPGSFNPPAVELVVVAGVTPNPAALGVAGLRNVFPDPAGFRAMTAPEQATADAAALLEAQNVAKASVDTAYSDLRAVRGLVASSNDELIDARDARKADIDAAGTPAAVQAFVVEELRLGLNSNLVTPNLDSTFDAMHDGNSVYSAGPETESAGVFSMIVTDTIPAFAHGGDFRIDWSIAAEPGSSNRSVEVRLRDVTAGINLTQQFSLEPKDSANVESLAGHVVVAVAASTPKTIELQFRLGAGAGTVTTYDGRITRYRLSSN